MTREQELVVLDDRFIRWLNYSPVEHLSARYILIHETRDNEITVRGLKTLAEVEEDILAAIEDQATGSNWQFEALFDTQGKGRELAVEIKTVVTIK